VKCDRVREAASARLDSEPIGMPVAVLDEHLATCADCARWLAAATRLTRQSRISTADVPDLSRHLLGDVIGPARRLLRRRWWLRAALVIVAIVQVAISLPPLFGTSIDMAMSMHAAHETAAWNIALGVGFLFTALRSGRATGLLPVLATFVVVLGALCVTDVVDGAVSAGRLATHAGIVVGLALVFGLARVESGLPPQRAAVDADRDDRDGSGPLRGIA
jgi:predicted anti-sigma-YlaC factor YlaD